MLHSFVAAISDRNSNIYRDVANHCDTISSSALPDSTRKIAYEGLVSNLKRALFMVENELSDLNKNKVA